MLKGEERRSDLPVKSLCREFHQPWKQDFTREPGHPLSASGEPQGTPLLSPAALMTMGDLKAACFMAATAAGQATHCSLLYTAEQGRHSPVPALCWPGSTEGVETSFCI